MGSLSASGIPVAAKTSTTYRKFDIKIQQTDSTDDSEVIIVAAAEGPRVITSGSIVRDDGTVEYFEDRVWGLQFESRSSDARVARDGARNLSVPTSGNETVAVIETSLQPTTPQRGWVHTGNKVVGRDSTDDSLIDRTANSGAFD